MLHILNQSSTAISDLSDEQIKERLTTLAEKLEQSTEDKDILILELHKVINYIDTEEKKPPTLDKVLDLSAQIMQLIQRQRVCVDNIMLLQYVGYKNLKDKESKESKE